MANTHTVKIALLIHPFATPASVTKLLHVRLKPILLLFRSVLTAENAIPYESKLYVPPQNVLALVPLPRYVYETTEVVMTFIPTEIILISLLLASINLFLLFILLLLTLFSTNKVSIGFLITPLLIFLLCLGILNKAVDFHEENCELEKTYYEELTIIAHSPNPTQLEISYYNNTLHDLQKFEAKHPVWLSGKYNWKEQPDL